MEVFVAALIFDKEDAVVALPEIAANIACRFGGDAHLFTTRARLHENVQPLFIRLEEAVILAIRGKLIPGLLRILKKIAERNALRQCRLGKNDRTNSGNENKTMTVFHKK